MRLNAIDSESNVFLKVFWRASFTITFTTVAAFVLAF